MPKAYWIARVSVTDDESYPEYIRAATPVYERYGAKFLVRGGDVEDLEGLNRARNVVIEWPDYETALAAYNSSEYQAARAIRQRSADSDVIIVAGV